MRGVDAHPAYLAVRLPPAVRGLEDHDQRGLTMIRNATAADIPACIAMAERMHGESRFARLRWSRAKVGGLMDWCLTNNEGFFSVAEREGVLIGGMIGACTPHWCSDDLVAYDFGLFVEPERPGGRAAAGLCARESVGEGTEGAVRW